MSDVYEWEVDGFSWKCSARIMEGMFPDGGWKLGVKFYPTMDQLPDSMQNVIRQLAANRDAASESKAAG